MRIGILFDLDGTLLDTLDDLADGTNYIMRRFGYPEHTREDIRRFVGNGAKRLLEQAVPDGVDPEPAFEAFKFYYAEHCQIKTAPYPGIPEALERLKKVYPLAIVSNKPDSAVKPLCAQHFPGVYALGEGDGCPRKPAPDMIFKAMQAIGVERCIYVGDSDVDVLTAENAGMPCLSVLWGFRDRKSIEAAGGNRFCQNPEQMTEILMAGFEERENGK